jgi:hypothetical protein
VKHVRLSGRLVSGDALSCQRAVCRQIRRAGGHDLFAVQEHQPRLRDDLTRLCRDPPPGERFMQARTVTKHSGRREERQVRPSAA